jgi:hypothetical protein
MIHLCRIKLNRGAEIPARGAKILAMGQKFRPEGWNIQPPRISGAKGGNSGLLREL